MSHIFCLRKDTCTAVVSQGKIALAIGLSALSILITSMTSLNTSLRNTGWGRHTPKINLSKSDISPERLYHSRSRFSKKLMVSVGVSWNRKTNIFFVNLISHRKQKFDQNCYIDLLKISLLVEWRRHYPGSEFEFLQECLSHRAKVT